MPTSGEVRFASFNGSLLNIWTSCLLLTLCLVSSGAGAATRHALLIGIDKYGSDIVSPLGGAGADAVALAKTLTDVAGFPAANVHVLVNSPAQQPTRQAILKALDNLAAAVKPGDMVLFSFSGHGLQIAGLEPSLCPFDINLRDRDTVKTSAVSAAEIRSRFARMPAALLISLYDMCRSDPVAGRAAGSFNLLRGTQTRALAVSTEVDTPSRPKASLSLFACSPSERSYEWTAKNRGFFSYFVEQGLRRQAADAGGVVKVNSLLSYLNAAVPGAVAREVGAVQTPSFEESGPGVFESVLATGRPAGDGGGSAVSTYVGATPEARYATAFQKGYEAAQAHRFLEAQDQFEAAVRLRPKSAEAALAIGRAYETAADIPTAIHWFQRAAQIDPKNPDAWLRAACTIPAYRNQVVYPEFGVKTKFDTVHLWEQVFALNPRNPLVYLSYLQTADPNASPLLTQAQGRLKELANGNPFLLTMAGDRKQALEQDPDYLPALMTGEGSETQEARMRRMAAQFRAAAKSDATAIMVFDTWQPAEASFSDSPEAVAAFKELKKAAELALERIKEHPLSEPRKKQMLKRLAGHYGGGWLKLVVATAEGTWIDAYAINSPTDPHSQSTIEPLAEGLFRLRDSQGRMEYLVELEEGTLLEHTGRLTLRLAR